MAFRYRNARWVGRKLASARVRKGLTQSKAAEIAHVSPMSMSRYEAGTREISLDAIIRLAEHYGYSLDRLVGVD